MSKQLDEAGRVLSGANEGLLRQVVTMLQKLLGATGASAPKGEAKDKEAKEAATDATIAEAGQDGLSFSEIASAVQTALRAALGGGYVYIRDLFPTHVVYQAGWDSDRPIYRRTYTIAAAGAVTFGDAEVVLAQTIYVRPDVADACPYCGGDMAHPAALPHDAGAVAETDPIDEADAQELASDAVLLQEGAVSADGTARIKLIAPGWGSSGYYSEAVLKRDGAKAFPKGTKMYWDHPTATEEADRPERSLRDLAAELTSEATWADDPTHGPGLYADATVFGAYREAVSDLAPHIGTSIRALGRAEAGEAEGRRGPIVTQIATGKSVDFVTTPGAGGKVLQLFEAARSGRAAPPPASSEAAPTTPQETPIVNEQDAQALRESNAQLQQQVARLQEAIVLGQARSFAESTLAAIQLPAPTRARLVERFAASPVIANGELDRAATKTQIEEAAKAELDYLANLNLGGGQIVGMGSTTQPTAPSLEESKTKLQSALGELGLSESGAKIGASGR